MAIKLHIHNQAHDLAPQTLTFDCPELRIGSDPSCTLHLPVPAAPLQATILIEPRRVLLVEGPDGSTRLNRKPLAPHDVIALRDGDQLHIGSFLLIASLTAHLSQDASAEESSEHIRQVVNDRLDQHGVHDQAHTPPSPPQTIPPADSARADIAPSAHTPSHAAATPPPHSPTPTQRRAQATPPIPVIAAMGALVIGGIWLILLLLNII
jgi:hypothetical protein